ncbi:MAG: hypothetical protein ACRDGH_15495 [Candidatus Limnocylindria bacterium]
MATNDMRHPQLQDLMQPIVLGACLGGRVVEMTLNPDGGARRFVGQADVAIEEDPQRRLEAIDARRRRGIDVEAEADDPTLCFPRL